MKIIDSFAANALARYYFVILLTLLIIHAPDS